MNTTTHESTGVLVATDGSPIAKDAVDWAASEAAARREPLLIISAYPLLGIPAETAEGTAAAAMMSSILDEARKRRDECQDLVRENADRIQRRHPSLAIRTEIYEGDARDALKLYAPSASVVVLGSRGLGSVKTLLLGSVSFWATRHLEVPLVVVRPSDMKSLYSESAIAVGVASDARSESTLRAAFELAARRACSLTIANAEWDADAPARGWRERTADEVAPQRRHAIADLAREVGQDYPDVAYKLAFASGSAASFLVALGHTHEALVLGRRHATVLDFAGLGGLASSVIEHADGVTMIVPAAKAM